MGPRRARPALPALLALLGVLLPGPGSTHTFVHPRETTLARGGSTELNCSASCEQPSSLGLETTLTKTEVASGNNWKVFELRDVDQDSRPMCFSKCESQTLAEAILTVYWLPERVELAPLPAWQPVGEDVTVRCLVAGGAPRDRLSVVLLRGAEELSRQPAAGDPAEVTATVLARREDDGARFSCRAELDLRPLGLELLQSASAPRELRTFVLPVTPPRLAGPPILEVGQAAAVDCSLQGLFPAAEASVYLALGDQPLNATVRHNADALSATATVTALPDEEGARRLVCAVTLGNQSRDTRQNLTVYSFPAPNLTLSEPEVSEGTLVSVLCEAHAAAAATLSGAPAPSPPAPPGPRAHFLLNASAEDHGRSFSCSAALEVAGQVLHKSESRQLQVFYGPRLSEVDCPGNWTWQEGSQQTLRCQARGNPAPRLTCHRAGDGTSLPIGDVNPVRRELAGTYQCRAVSLRGEVSRQVVVNVLHHQDHLMAILLGVGTLILFLGTMGTAAYLYNRQRKIKKYKLQKAQEAASMKMQSLAAAP